MPTNYLPIIVDVDNNPRPGAPPRTPLRVAGQSITATFAWGANPGTASVTYVSTEQIAAEPITVGDALAITVGPHVFYGMCKLDTSKIGSDGNTRILEFADYREFLDWDVVYCAFNIPITDLVNGRRIRRYWHILPDNYQAGRKTYTDSPYLAYEIADFMFNAATVNIGWAAIYNFTLNAPVYGLDYLGGQKLSAALSDISQRLGTVFTHAPQLGAPFRLLWLRKGYGSLPAFPNNSEDRRIGAALSGYPSRIRLVGDRNLYQVLNLTLEKDWLPAWEAFVDFSTFWKDIHDLQGGDAEDWSAWQKAYARAKEITVAEYAAARGSQFADRRRFNGHSRLDMPAALYISSLLFRAFRPVEGAFNNVYNFNVSYRSAEMVGRNLARFSHDATSGLIAIDSLPGEGNGYAIAKGYMVGSDLFATINPHQFDLTTWADKQLLWQRVNFQIDESGEGGQFVVFEQPMVNASSIVTEIDGHVVVIANAAITVPPVKAALTFAAERFFYPPNSTGYLGTGSKDGAESIAGLNGEYLIDLETGSVNEVAFSDGELVNDKAADIAYTLLTRQPVFYEGGFRVQGIIGWQLSSIIDRVTIHNGPDGFWEQVDFTNERARNYFEPERNLDRFTAENSMFQGQAELQKEARQARLLAAGLKNPAFRQAIQDLMDGKIGNTDSLRTVIVEGATVSDVFPAGTPFFRDPVTPSRSAGLLVNLP